MSSTGQPAVAARCGLRRALVAVALTSCTGDELWMGRRCPAGALTCDDAGAPAPLEVHLQVNGPETTCGTCSVLIAQVQGGRAPYDYRWSDPALQGPGPHTVCPDEPSAYSVRVTDRTLAALGDAGLAHAPEAVGEVRCMPQDASTASPYLDGCWARTTYAADGAPTEQEELIVCEQEWLFGAPTWIAAKLPKLLRGGQIYQNSYDDTRTIIGQPVIVDIYLTNEPCMPQQQIGSISVDGRRHHQYCFTPEKNYAYALIHLKYGVILADQPSEATSTICAGCTEPSASP